MIEDHIGAKASWTSARSAGNNEPHVYRGERTLIAAPRTDRPFQFGLRGLLSATTLACVTAAAWRAVDWLAVYLPLTVLMVFIARVARRSGEHGRHVTWGLVLGASLFAHVVAAGIAYETLGEVRSCFLYCCLFLYVPCLVIYFCGGRAGGATAAVVLALIFVPLQLALLWRHVSIRGEVARIVVHVETIKRETGHYPRDLRGYAWTNASSKDYLKYDCSNGDLMIYYWSGNENASHWYSSNTGWGYYPD